MNRIVSSGRQSLLGSYLALFTSLGTLLCCALPSLLVFLGLGATMAALLSAAPWLVTLAQHRNVVFAISGTLISGNLFYAYRFAPRLRGKPANACDLQTGPSACNVAGRVSKLTLWVSAVIWLWGFTFAFVIARFISG